MNMSERRTVSAEGFKDIYVVHGVGDQKIHMVSIRPSTGHVPSQSKFLDF